MRLLRALHSLGQIRRTGNLPYPGLTRNFLNNQLKIFLTLIFLVALMYAIHGILAVPKLDRNWAVDQKVLADINLDGNLVRIKHIRNIFYRSSEDFDLHFYDKVFNLDEIESAWFMLESFGQFGAAHTLVSFGFEDGSFISISAEIRREEGENFNIWKGVLRQYELVYIIANESDVIKLRTNYRKNDVRLFPIKADKEVLRQVFVDMLTRAQKLATEPEFYNTITNNCVTNIVHHVRRFSDRGIPWWNMSYLLTEFSDKVVYNVGILDTQLSLHEAREYFLITEKAQRCLQREDFSSCIRRR